MKTLYLMRHAKSSWDDATLADFERPLNERGLRAAPFMGALMREKGYAVDKIISSPATRARMTAELVRDEIDPQCDIAYDERIYEAAAATLVAIIRELDDEAASVLLVGHNPGFEDTARFLTDQIFAMPTAALAVIDLPFDKWSLAGGSMGTIRALIRPKDEMKRDKGAI